VATEVKLAELENPGRRLMLGEQIV
jgi:hypothetical protein